jgi:SAM-dependent methyltransferase
VALDAFYRQSSADRFWRDEVFAQTREARLRKMYRPQADWAVDTIARYRPEARTAVDVGFRSELFLECVFAEASTLDEIVLAGRSNPATVSHHPRLSVRPGYMAVRPRHCTDVVFALDVLPRAADTEGLLGSIHDALVPGGLALFTTVSASGFDVRALWERAPNLYPPDRINLLSVEGLTAAFARAGFELLEFSTPGAFDVHAVRRAINADPEGASDRFIHHFVRHSSSDTLHRFQDFLQEHRLSSFARLVIRRPVRAGEGDPNAHR